MVTRKSNIESERKKSNIGRRMRKKGSYVSKKYSSFFRFYFLYIT